VDQTDCLHTRSSWTSHNSQNRFQIPGFEKIVLLGQHAQNCVCCVPKYEIESCGPDVTLMMRFDALHNVSQETLCHQGNMVVW